jgi:hypothetical protein
MPTTTYYCDYIVKHAELGWRQHKLKHSLIISSERKVSEAPGSEFEVFSSRSTGLHAQYGL